MILVSACLLGENCKYNGENNYNPEVEELLEDKEFISVCPEGLGGLPIPRDPAEIVGGDGEDVLKGQARLINKENEDFTSEFIKGARETLLKAKENNCKLAIMKARSPSCGNKEIYDGSFTGKTKQGIGVTAALLSKEGIKVINEEEIDKMDQLKEE